MARKQHSKKHQRDLAIDPSDAQELEHIFQIACDNAVTVDQPLVLISQIQRSGGTLLNKLFDGHPAVHSHPSELHIGHPTKGYWPELEPGAGPDDWLEMLHERWIGRRFEEGFGRRTLNRAGHPSLPFMLAPSLLDRIFRAVCAERPPRTARDILDRYFTAFFNAWLDYQGLREEPKSYVTAFTPRLAWGEGRGRFLSDYPDGRLIACHRDPRAWYASASRQKEGYSDLDEALALWSRGAEETLAAKAEHGDAVFVVAYEDLVLEPERVTRALARWLDIQWNPILLRPTFNRLPTVPNSSYRLIDWGISTQSLDHWREVLSAGTVATIESAAMDLDEQVRAVRDSS